MKNIGIKIISINEEQEEALLHHLQRFIIEGDYTLSHLAQQLNNQEIITLNISQEEKMPNFTKASEEFDELEIEYQLYQKNNGAWEPSTLEDLDIEQEVSKSEMMIGRYLLWGYYYTAYFAGLAIYDLYHLKYQLHWSIALIATLVTALTPIVGSGIALWSSIELWDWHWMSGTALYFGYYLVPIILFGVYFIYLRLRAYIRPRWYRFWYPEFR